MIERSFSAIIGLIAWVGLAVQFDATMVTTESVAGSVWAMLLYFTIIANFATAVVFTALAFGLDKFASPLMIGGVTISMLLVGVVYNTVLSGTIELSGGAKLADFLNHRVTPAAVSMFWLFVADKRQLSWKAPLQWAALPVLYFVYGLSRGVAEGSYPYPFMNLARLGWARTSFNAILMAAGFAAVGFGMVWLARKITSNQPHRR